MPSQSEGKPSDGLSNAVPEVSGNENSSGEKQDKVSDTEGSSDDGIISVKN